MVNIVKKLKSTQTFLDKWDSYAIQICSVGWGNTLSIKLFKEKTSDHLIISCINPKIKSTLGVIENTKMSVTYDGDSKIYTLKENEGKCIICCDNLNVYEYLNTNNYKKFRLKKVKEYNQLFTSLNLTIKIEQIINDYLVIKLFTIGQDRFTKVLCTGSIYIDGELENVENEKLVMSYDEQKDNYTIMDTGGNFRIICTDIQI